MMHAGVLESGWPGYLFDRPPTIVLPGCPTGETSERRCLHHPVTAILSWKAGRHRSLQALGRQVRPREVSGDRDCRRSWYKVCMFGLQACMGLQFFVCLLFTCFCVPSVSACVSFRVYVCAAVELHVPRVLFNCTCERLVRLQISPCC